MQSQRDPDTELPACSFRNWRMHPESSGGAEAVALGDGGQLWFFIKGLIGSTNYVCV